MSATGALPEDPWRIDPAAFSACRSDAERMRVLANYAVLAPSSHNTQPWRFRIAGSARLELRADRGRALPIVDPHDRALVISCGAALANMRLAADALGAGLRVDTLPDPLDTDLIARIRMEEAGTAKESSAPVLRAIVERRTTRSAFAPDPVPQAPAPR